MRNFHTCIPDRQYETYCPVCKRKEPLTWKDIEWLQIYQDVGQHPRYRCIPCTQAVPDGNTTWMQVRPVRQVKAK